MPAFEPLAPVPFLTADLRGVGGVIKEQPEDFIVEEIPAYEPSGRGCALVKVQPALSRLMAPPPCGRPVSARTGEILIALRLTTSHVPSCRRLENG